MTASVAAGLSGDSGWILTAATFVVAGLLLVPGWIVGRSACLAVLSSLAVAPALSSAIIAAAEILAHVLALPWLPWGWAVIAGLTAVVALMARLIVGAPPECAQRAVSQGRAEWAILAAGLTVAVIVPAGVILTVLPGPGYPAQVFDVTFHLNVVVAIREGGNASMLGGLSALYSGRTVYYPTVWHGAVALAPGSPAPVSTAGVLALTAVVWPPSLLGLLARAAGLDAARASETDRARRRQRTCAVAAVLALSAVVVGFPLLPMTALAVWPYALSVAGLPGVFVLYDLLRQETASWRLRLVLVLPALAAGGGVVAAHGIGPFNLAVLSPPFLVNFPVSRWRRSATRRGGRALLVAGAVASVLVLAVGVWVTRASLVSALGYQRPAGGVGGIVATLGQALIDLSMYGAVPGASLPVGIVFGGLTLAAAWPARAHRDQRLWLVMWLLSLLLVVLVGGPQWAGRQLGAPWYLQKARILPLVILPALVLMVQAGVGRPGRRLWGWLRRLAPWVGGARPQRATVALLAALVLLPVVARVPLERNLVASVYDPQRIKYGTLLTEDVLALIERSRSVLPQDAVVLGAPSRGVAHLWSLGGVHVVYPTRDQTAPGIPGATLPSAWPTLGQKGSQTCALLNWLGVRYFYSSSDATAAGSVAGVAPLRWDAPLTRIPSEGFELIDSQGSTSLWRITACD